MHSFILRAWRGAHPWLLGLIVVFCATLALVFLPARLLRYDQATLRADPTKATVTVDQVPLPSAAIDKYRVTLAQVIGGVAFLLGLYFTARNVFATEQTRWTKTFSDAIGQLASTAPSGAPNVPIRVGAIYSLERLGRDSPADIPSICNILLHYIQAEGSHKRKQSDFLPDCEAALLALSSVTRGRTLLKNSVLADVSLPNLQLVGRKLTNLSFRSSILSGSRFDGSRQSSLEIANCDLDSCSFVNSKMKSMTVSASKGSGLNFSACSAVGAKFISCSFRDSDFTLAKLQQADFSGTDFSGSDFSGADLRNVVASGAVFTDVSFHDANLNGSDLRGVIGLRRTDIETAKVKPLEHLLPKEWRPDALS